MSRLVILALSALALAACSEAGPYGYGYAVNERPSLGQLGAASGEAAANTFSPDRAVQEVAAK